MLPENPDAEIADHLCITPEPRQAVQGRCTRVRRICVIQGRWPASRNYLDGASPMLRGFLKHPRGRSYARPDSGAAELRRSQRRLSPIGTVFSASKPCAHNLTKLSNVDAPTEKSPDTVRYNSWRSTAIFALGGWDLFRPDNGSPAALRTRFVSIAGDLRGKTSDIANQSGQQHPHVRMRALLAASASLTNSFAALFLKCWQSTECTVPFLHRKYTGRSDGRGQQSEHALVASSMHAYATGFVSSRQRS